jgi:hypothetical protein
LAVAARWRLLPAWEIVALADGERQHAVLAGALDQRRIAGCGERST